MAVKEAEKSKRIESRCNICVDQKCDGAMTCNCSSCVKKKECHRVLSPIIRITTKCTQQCDHCCFDCSPKKDDMMSVDTAKETYNFFVNNNIYYVQLMGGEFFCNPDWEEIIDILTGDGIDIARLTTNSDWAGNKKTAKKVLDMLKNNDKIVVALSEDKWHTNKHLEKAWGMLNDAGIACKRGKNIDDEEMTIVPVGRGVFHYGIFSSFATYCSKPCNRYTFLIDEMGDIYKCGFGVWDYANVNEYQNGGFDKRFKEFNENFYSLFIGSCTSCARGYNSDLKKRGIDKKIPYIF